MPAATVPVPAGKPAPAAAPKPAATGFVKPAGLSRQTVSNKVEEDEEIEAGPKPVHLGISIAAVLVSLLFIYAAYSADHTPNRVSSYLFPEPQAAESADSDYDASSSDEGSDSSSDDEGSGEEEEEEE